MAAAKAKALPSWARLVKPVFKKREDEALSVEEEEAYLRTRSYHALSQEMDRAAEASLRTLGESFHSDMDALLNQLEPVKEDSAERISERISKRARVETEDSGKLSDQNKLDTSVREGASAAAAAATDDLSAMFTVEPCRRYNPLLLPILVIDGPTYQLDRHDWMNYLVKSSKKRRPRNCTVRLQIRSTSIKGHDDVTLHEELARQCLAQEEEIPKMLRKKSFMEKASITDILLEWAQSTTAFDGLVVFLEAEDNNFYSTPLQDFIGWATDRRALNGLPISIVLLGPHAGRRQLDLKSTAQGPAGVLIRKVSLPSTTTFLDTFWERLWVDQEFPVLFPSSVIERLNRSYLHQNSSAIHAIMKLKLSLAHALCSKGSFLMAARALPEERERINWFLSSRDGRKTLSVEPTSGFSLLGWTKTAELKRRRGCIALEVSNLLNKLQGARSPLIFLDSSALLSQSNSTMERKDKTQVLSLLESVRKRVASRASPRPGDPFQLDVAGPVMDTINRLIVLCDSCDSFDQMSRCIGPLVDDWGEQSLTVPFTENASLFSSALLAALDTQPRRHAVRGLLEQSLPTANPARTAHLVKLVGNMYALIQDRVAVLRSEWFQLFRHTFALEMELDEAYKHFGYGIFHLKLCGLLREKKLHQKNDVRYEKTLLVWCSGD